MSIDPTFSAETPQDFQVCTSMEDIVRVREIIPRRNEVRVLRERNFQSGTCPFNFLKVGTKTFIGILTLALKKIEQKSEKCPALKISLS